MLIIAGCASGPSGMHSGGSSSMVNGIEFWKGGPPARAYHVLATVQKQGANNGASYAEEETLLADSARHHGADAVIVDSEVMVVDRMDVVTGRPVMVPKVNAELIKYQ